MHVCRGGAGGDNRVCPVAQSLANSTVTLLRAVGIVSTRELTSQIEAVFVVIGGSIKIGSAARSQPLVVERKMLALSSLQGKCDALVTMGGLPSMFAPHPASRWNPCGTYDNG